MKRILFLTALTLAAGVHTTAAPPFQATTAARLSACDFVPPPQSPSAIIAVEQDVTVSRAERVEAGRFTPPGARAPLTGAPSFCRVQARVTTNQSLVNFELWMPASWNGKLVVTGNGGYSNVPSYRDMAYALTQGYAAVGGDTGHQTPTPDDLQWGVGHLDRIIDWGERSINLITRSARPIIERMRGSSPTRAYYYGCSTGGHQGYAEMQHYPEDFDGVIAGAPGNNRVRLNTAYLWQFLSNHTTDGREILPAAKLPLVTRAVVAACDKNDGVVDGVIDDPRSCEFDARSLTCRSGDAPDCLTPPQVAALNKMYGGVRNPQTGDLIYPGWPKSSEALTTLPDGRPASGWHQYWGTTEPMRANFWRLWVFGDPQWNPRTFDFDKDVAAGEQRIGSFVDQRSTDLRGFKRRGAVAIVYQGWQDPVVNPIDTITYYEQVRAQGSQEETDRFLRLFMVPGMGHCGGGTGTTTFGNQGGPSPTIDADHDLLSALDRWVEEQRPPDRIIASRVEGGRVTRTRPLCVYPKRAVYLGTGSTDDAANFVCR